MGTDNRLTLATALDGRRETWLGKIRADLMEKIRRSLIQSEQHQEDQKNQDDTKPVSLKQDRSSRQDSMQQSRDCMPVSSHYEVTMQQEAPDQSPAQSPGSKTEVPYHNSLQSLGSHCAARGSRPVSMPVSMPVPMPVSVQEDRGSVAVTMEQHNGSIPLCNTEAGLPSQRDCKTALYDYKARRPQLGSPQSPAADANNMQQARCYRPSPKQHDRRSTPVHGQQNNGYIPLCSKEAGLPSQQDIRTPLHDYKARRLQLGSPRSSAADTKYQADKDAATEEHRAQA